MSSGDVIAKEGDLVTLLCSAEGEPPITFSWEKDRKPLDSLTEIEKPYRCSLLVVKVKDETSFGKYICHVHDRFQSTNHTFFIQKQIATDGARNEIVGIIVLAILLVISVVVIAYLIYRARVGRLKSSSTTKNMEKSKDNSKDIYENPGKDDVDNYEQVGNEKSTYTALKRPGKEENDDHVYSHLNEAPQKYENQAETGL